MKSIENELKEEYKKDKEKIKSNEINYTFSWLEIFSFSSVIFLLFLLPFFSFSFNLFSIVQTKISVIVFLTFFSILLFTAYFLKSGILKLGKFKLLVLAGAFLIPFSYLLSTFFSGGIRNSFSGKFFEIDTSIFLFLSFSLLAITAIFFKDRKKIFLGFITFLFSAFILSLLQFLGIVFGNLPFSNEIDFSAFNFVGSWNEFALIIGASTILSTITLFNIKPGWFLKIFLYLICIVSLFFLLVINSTLTWSLIAIFTFGVCAYFVTKKNLQKKFKIFSEDEDFLEKENKNKYLIIVPIIFLFFAGISLFKSDLISNKIFNFIEISQIEARPSLESTIEVGKNVYDKSFLFGSGPNTFKMEWAKYKPDGINSSVFWDKDFNQGFSYITTSAVSTGFLGILAWIIFFILFLYTGAKILLFYKVKEKFPYYLSLSSFITALYFWLSLIFYTTGPVLITLAFIFTGMFVASVSLTKEDLAFDFLVSDKPRLGFVMIFLFGIIFILSIGGVFVATEKFSANISFERALAISEDVEKIDNSEFYINRAINIEPQDVYFRLATDIKIKQIKNILSGEKELKEDDYKKFRNLLASAINKANSAVFENKKYYKNWLKLGDVYSSVISLNVSGSYEKSKEIYEKAISLSPNNPLIFLKIARADASNKNFESAKENINKALNLKYNYTEAVFLLSQIQIKEDDIDSAIKTVESASLMKPNDSTLLFQLGVLYYNNENYKKASENLEKTISISKNYSNAKYFLGLSYYNLEEKEKALEQFYEISKVNPDNKEIKIIIENMKAGRDPFSEITKGDKGENELPVEL